MSFKEYKQEVIRTLPVFCVFILGAIAQLAVSNVSHLLLQFVMFTGAYLIAVWLHDLSERTKERVGDL